MYINLWQKQMSKKILLPLLIFVLIVFGALYLLEEKEDSEITQVEETVQEEIVMEKDTAEWEIFANNDFSYTAQYPQNWEIDSDDFERVWFYNEMEEIAILFASETATQTGFPEYELITQEETLVDGNPANTSLLYSENTRAILTVFESENHPHFLMMTYECTDGSQDEEMMEFNEEFLSRITFQ